MYYPLPTHVHSGTRVMLVHVVVPPCEASSFIHSICHSLHELHVCSHVANITVAMEVAQQTSKTDFQFECTAK